MSCPICVFAIVVPIRSQLSNVCTTYVDRYTQLSPFFVPTKALSVFKFWVIAVAEVVKTFGDSLYKTKLLTSSATLKSNLDEALGIAALNLFVLSHKSSFGQPITGLEVRKICSARFRALCINCRTLPYQHPMPATFRSDFGRLWPVRREFRIVLARRHLICLESLLETNTLKLTGESDEKLAHWPRHSTHANDGHFGRDGAQITRQGASYNAEFLTQAEFDQIANSSGQGHGGQGFGAQNRSSQGNAGQGGGRKGRGR